jgi:hypothetical protein
MHRVGQLIAAADVHLQGEAAEEEVAAGVRSGHDVT